MATWSESSISQKALGFAGAVPVAALGAAVLAGWVFELRPLVQFLPGYAVMQPNTAVGFLIVAVALLALQARAFWAATPLGWLMILLACLTLVEHGLLVNLGIDQLLIRPFLTDPYSFPGRMTAATALCFLVTGAGLIGTARVYQERTRPLFPLAAAALLMLFAVLGMIGYASSLLGGVGFTRLQGMPVHTAAGFLIIGAMLAFHTRRAGVGAPRAEPAAPFVVAVLVLLMGVTFAGFQWMLSDARARVQTRFETDSANLADDIRDRMPVYGLALRGAVEFVEHGGPKAMRVAYLDHWTNYVAGLRLIDSAPGFRELGFAETRPNGKAIVTLAAPLEPANRALIGLDLAEDPVRRSAMTEALDTGEPVLTAIDHLLDLAGSEAAAGLLIVMPVFPEAEVAADQAARRRLVLGYAFFRFHTTELLKGIIGDRYPGIRVEVFDGDPERKAPRLFDSEPGAIAAVVAAAIRVRGVNVLNRRWTLRTTPLPAFSRAQRTNEPWVFLGAGLLVSALLTLLLWQLLVNQERRRSLEAANQLNRQLDAFAHTVAHDLQQPVAGVIGYSHLLLEDHAEAMPPKVKELVGNLAKVGERMDDLVQGLLTLSTAVRAPIERERVDVTDMAWQIAGDLQVQHPERQVEIVITEGLSVRADRQLVRALLGNLIGNAWKYSSRAAQPWVEVGVSHRDPRRPFFVRDNGVGFDIADAQHLFTPFRRLPTGKAFPGHGIGLATVQRIVERHDGQIWAEGKAGEGAIFYFTLGADVWTTG